MCGCMQSVIELGEPARQLFGVISFDFLTINGEEWNIGFGAKKDESVYCLL